MSKTGYFYGLFLAIVASVSIHFHFYEMTIMAAFFLLRVYTDETIDAIKETNS